MALIDQRILIAASAEAVWSYLATPALMVKWHTGCKQISVLSTRTSGVGMRRRCTDARGKTVVEEITAWLENLGYEYVMIDGPYRSFRARLRLQPIPEGTVVNWTVEYQLRGVASGVRSLLGIRRRLENQMADSLRQLKRSVESSGARVDRERQARFAMQSAPDVEKRAAIAASRAAAETAVASPTDTETPESSEANELTVANPTVVSTVGADVLTSLPNANADAKPDGLRKQSPSRITSEITPEPSFLAKLKPDDSSPVRTYSVPDESSLADTKPRPPKGLREAIQAVGQTVPTGSTPPSSATPTLPPTPAASEITVIPTGSTESYDPAALTVPISLVAPPAEPPAPAGPTEAINTFPPTLPELAPTPPVVILPPLPKEFLAQKAASAPPEPDRVTPPEVPPPTTIHDTGELSIWEVFGVAPPSEQTRTDLQAIIASLQTPPASETPATVGLPRSLMRKAHLDARVSFRGPRGLERLRALGQVKVRSRR